MSYTEFGKIGNSGALQSSDFGALSERLWTHLFGSFLGRFWSAFCGRIGSPFGAECVAPAALGERYC